LKAGVKGVILGAGHSLGTAYDGTENGPFFLRTLSKAYTWSAAVPTVIHLDQRCAFLRNMVDIGDIAFDGATLPEALFLIKSTINLLPPQVVPCVIGGDHTVTFAVVQALVARRKKPLWVLHFDHHLDLNLRENLANQADTPREGVFNTNVMSHVAREIGPGRLLQIGIAPFVTVESANATSAIRYLDSVGKQICLGSQEIRNKTLLSQIMSANREVYLTIDVDVLDRAEMASTNSPANMGLQTHELLFLIDVVLGRNRLVGFDLVEFAACRDARDAQTLADGGRAVMVFLHLLAWLGRQRSEPGVYGCD
jgi:arginase family enzyme